MKTTLTQQQINQYQWQVADGVARIVNPFENIECHACEQNSDTMQACTCTKFESIDKINVPTNAPDGTYNGEAFEEPQKQLYNDGLKGWIAASDKKFEDSHSPHRIFLRLNPSHLPAVLTTQPGDELKDRYKPLYEYYNAATDKWAECDETHGHPVYPTRITWRLITPPAEQEAETEPYYDNLDDNILSVNELTEAAMKYAAERGLNSIGSINFIHGAEWQADQLQSILTQKDQRIAELEREREWISVEDRLPKLWSDVLVFTVSEEIQYPMAVYSNIDKHDFYASYDKNPADKITHWQPLPNPPQH